MPFDPKNFYKYCKRSIKYENMTWLGCKIALFYKNKKLWQFCALVENVAKIQFTTK